MAGERQILKRLRRLALALALAWAAPAMAQIGLPGLPGGLPGNLPGGLPGNLGDVPRRGIPDTSLPSVTRPVRQLAGTAGDLAGAPLTEVRRLTAERLLRDHRDVVEADDRGQPVVRGEVLAVGLRRETLERLRQAGFTARSQSRLDGLPIEATVLSLPRGQSAVEAIRRLRALDPAGQYDFNHIYLEAGVAAEVAGEARRAGAAADGRGLRIGLVDGSVAQSAPALSRTRLVQRAFAPGGARTSVHATAVASLIAGSAGPFRSPASGATLYVADVYGPTPTGGSAEAVARALAWLAQSDTAVVNISLVGPPNLLLGAAVKALQARGSQVVAAVGNDGPAAPPLYPAAYPGVVAVTGVDAGRRVLAEAGRGTHVDFAAPGADMAAAGAGGGYISVRGTSFAAPIVAGRLAVLRAHASPAEALEALAREAVDLGAPGADPVYGHGLVGADFRTDPAAVRASR
jgi:hypothetical protein